MKIPIIRLATLAVALLAPLLALAVQPASAAPGDITMYDASGLNHPSGVTSGPDGNIWFSNFGTQAAPGTSIGRINKDTGEVTIFDGAAQGVSGPVGITQGHNGTLWFTSFQNDRIGLINPTTGAISTYANPVNNVDGPHSIASGPGGYMYFTSFNNDRIGRISVATGALNTYDTGPAGVDGPQGIAVGVDGNMWFTSNNNDSIGRFNPSTGEVTMYPGAAAGVDGPQGISWGPGGDMWFTSQNNDRIGRINVTTGAITTYIEQVNRIDSPSLIMAGSDNYLYFTSYSNSRIGRIDPATGAVATLQGEASGVENPVGIAQGLDGNIWFSSFNNSRMARLEPGGFTEPGDPEGAMTVTKSGPATIARGHQIHYDITITNTGDVPLTGVSVTDANAPRCSGSEADIPVGQRRLVECSIVATEVGSLDNTASVTSNETGAVSSNTVTTTVTAASDCRPPAFRDVSESHPFFTDICWMADEGVSRGYPGGYYRPSSAVTRMAMSAFMYRLAGEPEFTPGSPSFRDVPTSHPFFRAIEWMAAKRITTGYPGGYYRPSSAVTRMAMSAFMYRLAGEPEFTPGSPSFRDVPSSSQFFRAIEWMAEERITTGYPGGYYRPASAVTRMAMSAFMHRLAVGPGVDV